MWRSINKYQVNFVREGFLIFSFMHASKNMYFDIYSLSKIPSMTPTHCMVFCFTKDSNVNDGRFALNNSLVQLFTSRAEYETPTSYIYSDLTRVITFYRERCTETLPGKIDPTKLLMHQMTFS